VNQPQEPPALALEPAWGAALRDGQLVLRPRLPDGVGSIEAHRVRVHRTVLDLSVRRRPGALVVRLGKRFGPDLGVDLAWAGPERVTDILLDEQRLTAATVRFLARHEHEAQFFLADGNA
jgi:hypothetical protein